MLRQFYIAGQKDKLDITKLLIDKVSNIKSNNGNTGLYVVILIFYKNIADLTAMNNHNSLS
jgi:hypothetical protein